MAKLKTIYIFILITLVLITKVHAESKIQETTQSTEILKATEETASQFGPIGKNSLLWIEDNLPEDVATDGEWVWEKDIVISGTHSHANSVQNGIHSHSFKVSNPIKLGNNSTIEQYVYIDTQNPTKGIMIKLFSADKGDMDFYWEAEEEVFVDTLEYIKAEYMGFLPKAGKWHKLIIDMKKIEIKNLELLGISFVGCGGRIYWDRTLITNTSK